MRYALKLGKRQLPDGRVLVGQGQEGAVRGGTADNSTGPRQETAGEGIPTGAQWRRRAAGGALAIDMATLRSVGRCERFGLLQRRMPLAPRALPAPFAYHTCCVFIEPTVDAGMPALPRSMTSTRTYVIRTQYSPHSRRRRRVRCGG